MKCYSKNNNTNLTVIIVDTFYLIAGLRTRHLAINIELQYIKQLKETTVPKNGMIDKEYYIMVWNNK